MYVYKYINIYTYRHRHIYIHISIYLDADTHIFTLYASYVYGMFENYVDGIMLDMSGRTLPAGRRNASDVGRHWVVW